MIRFVDLFSGTGGIRLGLEQAAKELGISTQHILSCDIDKKCNETYAMNFGDTPLGDIRNVADCPQFDLLLAGFPCQPFSYAGKQRGFGDTRGTLFFEIERILKKQQPEAFLLENVRGLTTHDKGRTFKTIITHLENLGYGVQFVILNSSSFGVPQNRLRVYVLGLKGKVPKLTLKTTFGSADSHTFKTAAHQATLLGTTKAKVVKDILEKHVDSKYLCSPQFTKQLASVVNGNFEALHGVRLIDYRNGNSIHSWELGTKGVCIEEEIDFMNALVKNRRLKKFGTEQDGKKLTLEDISTFFKHKDLPKIMNALLKKGYLKQTGDKFNPVAGNMSFEVFKFLDPESISITLVSSDANRLGVVQNGVPRRITPREAARIQGYPNSYKIHPVDSVAYHQFGNAVAVPVIKMVLEDFLSNNSLESSQQAATQKESSDAVSTVRLSKPLLA
jgi:DNA (cytosine-5)-methyltransferase 1